MSVFTTLRRTCTEHKPGYLHAASQWAHTATATPLQPPHTNVTTNVNGMYLYDLYVKFLHFDSMSTKSVTVKLSIYSTKKKKKKVQKLYFLGGLLKSVKFIIWAHFAANGNGCQRLSFQHKKRCCYCQECKPATQTKLLSSSSEKLCLLLFIILFGKKHFNGPIIGPILMSDKILLICGARLKPDDKSSHFANKRNSWNDCVDSYN